MLSLEDGILTLRFPRDGDVKGFSVSGHDAMLKRVLSTDFGLNVTIKGVAGGDVAAQAGRPEPERRRRPARPRSGGIPPPRRRRPRHRNLRGRNLRGRNSPRPTTSRTTCRPAAAMTDEPSPDDRAVRNAELTGMDLIQRELGGQVIGEFEG